MSQNQPFHAQRLQATTKWLVLLTIVSASFGCNSFGNARLVKELQGENERLLAEFRAQRDRAEELEKANRQQAARLDESEKLLARLTQSTGGTGRLSSLPASPGSLNAGSGFRQFGTNTPGSAEPPLLGRPPNLGQIDEASGLRWQPRIGAAE